MKYLIIGIIVVVGIVLLGVYSKNNNTNKSIYNSTSHNTERQYSCHRNIYNCSDFSSQREAQDVFNACGRGDVHNLDGDNDGIACEGL